MTNFWVMFRYEYRKRVGTPGFLIASFGIPLVMAAVMGVIIFVTTKGNTGKPLGYIDRSGLFNSGTAPADSSGEIRRFEEEGAARAALERGEIQAFYIIPAGYPQERQVALYYGTRQPSKAGQESFARFLRNGLTSGFPANARARLVEMPALTVRSMDGKQEFGEGNFIQFIIPIAAGFLMVILVMNSAGYLLQVVADEKENRTIEILATSLSPVQLMGGKALGLMAVALTQMSLWLLAIGAFWVVGARYWQPLQNARLPWDFLLVLFLFFLPTYALIAGMMSAIGAAVGEIRQGQQIAGLLNLMFILPYFFTAMVITNPGSPWLTVLTLFPATSFATVSLRWGMTSIPFWQLAAGWALLSASACLSLWAAARIFRLGMLRYGQSLSLRSVFSSLPGLNPSRVYRKDS